MLTIVYESVDPMAQVSCFPLHDESDYENLWRKGVSLDSCSRT